MASKIPQHTLNHTIQLFYFQTSTPEWPHFLDNPKITAIVDALIIKMHKLPALRGVTLEECTNIVHYILRLVDAPKNLQGILALQPCIGYLINCAAEELSLIPENFKETIKALVSLFYKVLETSSNPQDLALYLSKPLLATSTLARFHYDAYHYCLLDDNTFPLYHTYGYVLHNRIRYNSQLGLEDKTVEDYIRSARYFFKYMPQEIKTLKQYDPVKILDYIEAFVEAYNISETNSHFPLTARAITYKRTFKRLVFGWEGRPSPRLGYIPEDELIPIDGDIEYFDKDDASYQNAAVTLDENSAQLLDEPYPDIELGFLKRAPSTEFPDKKPALSRQWIDLVNLRSFYYPWDAKHLNLFHYGLLYQSMSWRYGQNDKVDMMIIFILIMIHTGINYKKLLTLIASDELLPEKKLILRKINDRYYILYKSFVIRKESTTNDHCHRTSSIIHIPLPGAIMSLFPDSPSTGAVFGYVNSKGNFIPLNGDDIKRFIKKITRPNDLNIRSVLRITPSKISTSFLSLYNMRAGLDELMCTYISGHDHHRLFSSQAHYVHLPHAFLEERYLSSFYLVNELIADNYRTCVKRNFLSDFANGNPPLLDKLLSISRTNNTQINTSLPGYGSPIIIKDDYLHIIIKALKKRIRRELNIINRYNLYICYAYLALQLSTGMRPRNCPNITWENFSEPLESITIRDKTSVVFHEVRNVPLAPRMVSILQNIRTQLTKLRSYVARTLNPSFFNENFDDIFFFIDNEGRRTDFTLANFSTLLRGVVPDYTLPYNMPRHYLRNFLYHSGISNDLADAIFGHQHNGRELLNVISSSRPSDIGKFVLPIINKMLKQLDIDQVIYV